MRGLSIRSRKASWCVSALRSANGSFSPSPFSARTRSATSSIALSSRSSSAWLKKFSIRMNPCSSKLRRCSFVIANCVVGVATAMRPGSSVVEYPALLENELERGQRDEDQKQTVRHRRSVTCLVPFEAVGVDQVYDCHGRELRSTASEDVDLIEHLPRADETVHHHEEGGWRDERQSDMPKAVPATGAVDLGGLVILLRNALESSQEEHRVESGGAPDRHQDDRRHRQHGIT